MSKPMRGMRRAGWLSGAAVLTALAAVALIFGPVRAVQAGDPPEEKPATAPDNPTKPPSFSDEDLEKYHKPKPGAPKPAEPQPAAAPAPQSPAAPGPAAPRPPGPAAAKVPVSSTTKPAAPAPATTTRAPAHPATAAQPAQDPMKPWKDREARTAFRQEQLRTLRDRISALQSRLDYLNQKRLSILDPLRVMPKPQTEDDRAADAVKGPRDLLASVDEEIKTTEDDLKQAKDDLLAIETHFAQESDKP